MEYHSVNTSFVAGFNKKLDIGVHERDCHSDIAAIGENIFRMIAELFNKTEHVILQVSLNKKFGYPSTAVQSR